MKPITRKIRIEKDHPLEGNPLDPFIQQLREMELNVDSFLVPRHGDVTSIHAIARRYGMKIKSHKINKRFRIWRVA
jgi:hypothetical protein